MPYILLAGFLCLRAGPQFMRPGTPVIYFLILADFLKTIFKYKARYILISCTSNFIIIFISYILISQVAMDINKFEEYKKRVDLKLTEIDAIMSFLNKGVQGLSAAFKEFREEMKDFMSFSAYSFSAHEKRLRDIERKLT